MFDWLSSTNSKTAKQIELNLLLDLRMVLGHKKIRSGFWFAEKNLTSSYLIFVEKISNKRKQTSYSYQCALSSCIKKIVHLL